MNLSDTIDDALSDVLATGKHVLRVMDESGDLKVTWDPENEIEVENARKLFDEMKAKGFGAFCVDHKGVKAKVMREFDPDAEALVMAPPMAGG